MDTKKSSNLPIILSALVCPGLGQFLQKRKRAGGLFFGSFILGFIWFMVVAGQLIIHFYKMGLEFETYEPKPISVAAILWPLGVSIVIYLVNLLDVGIAQQRLRASTAEQQFLEAQQEKARE